MSMLGMSILGVLIKAAVTFVGGSVLLALYMWLHATIYKLEAEVFGAFILGVAATGGLWFILVVLGVN